VHVVKVQPEMMNNQLTAPTRIPHDIKMVAEKEAPPSSGFGVAGMEGLGGGGVPGAFGDMKTSAPKVQAAAPKKVNISGGVAAGMLLDKTMPMYPPIAKAARVSGTVVLQATISKTGTITNLRVISGPAMLQQSAMDAVRSWRYRPYMLNGDPVEVDTTVNVVFSLGG
jgi:protein TonB